MKIPETVKVLGMIYRVYIGRRDLELAKNGHWGECRHHELAIDLRGDLSHQQLEEAFLHELIHCAEAAVVAESVPEQTVYGISAVLYAVLRDNGWWPE